MNPPGDSPTVARLRLGRRLRELRLDAEISGERAGRAIRATGSKISRIESGHVPVRQRDVADLLKLYQLSDDEKRAELLTLAEQSTGQSWWDIYADTIPVHTRRALEQEAAASMLVTYDPLAVPALLQTNAYAELASGRRGGWRAGLRADQLAHRRELLSSPSAPQLWALIDEMALQRPVERPEVLSAQIAALIKVSQCSAVTIQVVPADVTFDLGAATPFTITRFPHPDLPDKVWVELLTTVVGLERRSDVDAYWALVNGLAANAVPPDETVSFLRAL